MKAKVFLILMSFTLSAILKNGEPNE